MQAIEQTRTWCWRFDAADLNNSKMVVDLVDSICVECGVDLSRRADLELVMTEVINNAIDHGVLGLDSAMKKSPEGFEQYFICLLYTSPSPRDLSTSRMPSSA